MGSVIFDRDAPFLLIGIEAKFPLIRPLCESEETRAIWTEKSES